MPLGARLTTTLTLLAALGCAGAGKTAATAADESAIRAIDQQWNEALRTQNDSLIASFYTADAVLLPPNMPRVSGGDAIRKFWADIWPMKASLTLAPVFIRVSGDWAMEEGNYIWSSPLPNGGEFKDAGKYLVNWRKEQGRWRAVQDMWNSDTPPPKTQ